MAQHQREYRRSPSRSLAAVALLPIVGATGGDAGAACEAGKGVADLVVTAGGLPRCGGSSASQRSRTFRLAIDRSRPSQA